MQTLTLPNLGQAMEEGTVVEWLVDEGDRVTEGTPVVVIETEKVTHELPAEQDGVLLERLVDEGETVPVGTPLGHVGSPDEEPPETAPAPDEATEPEPGAGPSPSADTSEVRASPSARRAAREAGVDIDAVGDALGVSQVRVSHVEEYRSQDDAEPTGEIRGSPYARTVADDHGVAVTDVGEAQGTDRVRAADVEAYVEREQATDTAESATIDATAEASGGPAISETVPIEGAREVMFDRMSTVATEYGSTTTVARVDATELVALREQLAPTWEREYDTAPSLTAFVVTAAARALGEYPMLNAETVGDEEVRLYDDVNVGIAVNTDDGLLVPTVRDADERTVRDLSAAVTRLADAAREGDLSYDDLQDGTFTVSNAGNLGAYINTPQIKPPQTAILGMCTVFEDAGVVDGEVVPRQFMHLCLTYDHRVVEGATAVGFLQAVKDRLEHPSGLLS
jgi:pyruvate/2-oxoglutarate dehydrogenase complex dihydrolipoamide acyltransferase (E2) component